MRRYRPQCVLCFYTMLAKNENPNEVVEITFQSWMWKNRIGTKFFKKAALVIIHIVLPLV